MLLAAILGLALAARLGFWQLDRAAQKIALQQALAARVDLPPLGARALARTPAEVESQHFRRVVLHGRWLPSRTIFLDNRQMDDRVGFFVVTPLALAASNESVLIQRGWVPRDFTNREALPAIVTPAGEVSVDGVVAPPPSRLFQFADAGSGVIRQNLDIAAFARESGLALLPLSIQERDDKVNAGEGLARHWPAPATDVQKHYGYAFQWFAIGAGIAILHVWYRILRPRRRRR